MADKKSKKGDDLKRVLPMLPGMMPGLGMLANFPAQIRLASREQQPQLPPKGKRKGR
jgi:hypothetical protein